MLNHVVDFCIDMYDKCLSDVHCPMRFVLRLEDIGEIPVPYVIPEPTEDCPKMSERNESMYTQFNWSTEKAYKFHAQISEETVAMLCSKLSGLMQNVTQQGIDDLCADINKTMLNAAHDVGACKSTKIKAKQSMKQSVSQPWFNDECHKERKQYLKIKNKLKRNGCKSMANKETKKYKKFMKLQERKYHIELNKKIRYLRSNNAKEYWKLLNKSTEAKKKEGIKLSLGVFLEHFKKLNEAPLLHEGPDAGDNPDLVTENITNDSDEINEHLNAIFTSDEITANIHRLKNNKACGIDYIRNEFLKNVPFSLIHFICDLFNLILDSGIIPDIWCQGLTHWGLVTPYGDSDLGQHWLR